MDEYRIYHVEQIAYTEGRVSHSRVRLTSYPMTHEMCGVFISKHTNPGRLMRVEHKFPITMDNWSFEGLALQRDYLLSILRGESIAPEIVKMIEELPGYPETVVQK